MKALVFDSYGRAEDVLELRDIAEPEPGPGQVKVKMLYSPINPSDFINTIEGTYHQAVGRAIWNYGKAESEYTIDPAGERRLPALPHVPGLEGVGIVVAAGAGAYPRFLLNKRVLVIGGARGNWQQFNVVDTRQALPVSKGISDEQAAVSFVNPVTAYAMVREVLRCGKGDVLLQSAGNSELGKMIIRLGRKYGFQTISLIRDAAQEPHLRELGADHVIDISREDLKAAVQRITGGRGVPFALDPIAGSLGSDMLQCLGLGGRMLVYGTLSAEPLQFPSRDLMTPIAAVEGFFLTNWIGQKSLLKKLSVTRKAAALVRSGELATEISKAFALEDFQEALAEVRKPGNRGKVLFRCG